MVGIFTKITFLVLLFDVQKLRAQMCTKNRWFSKCQGQAEQVAAADILLSVFIVQILCCKRYILNDSLLEEDGL